MLLVDSVIVLRNGDEFLVNYAGDISPNMGRMKEVGDDEIIEPEFFPYGNEHGEENAAEVPIILEDHHAKLLAGLEMMEQAMLDNDGSTTISSMFQEFATLFFTAGVKYGWQDTWNRPRKD